MHYADRERAAAATALKSVGRCNCLRPHRDKGACFPTTTTAPQRVARRIHAGYGSSTGQATRRLAHDTHIPWSSRLLNECFQVIPSKTSSCTLRTHARLCGPTSQRPVGRCGVASDYSIRLSVGECRLCTWDKFIHPTVL